MSRIADQKGVSAEQCTAWLRNALAATGSASDVTVHAATACRYPVALLEDDSINAFADGKMVGITMGMMRFSETDDELALVIGHELAHNALGHPTKRRVNVTLGAILGAAVDVAAARRRRATFRW